MSSGLVSASVAFAQLPAVPVNPGFIEFDSVDHQYIQRYEVGFFLNLDTTSNPTGLVVFPRPTECMPCRGPLSYPLVVAESPVKVWYIAVRGISNLKPTDWSNRVELTTEAKGPSNLKFPPPIEE